MKSKSSDAGARIQWKGTEVCMDCYCTCGDPFHIDGFFAMHVQCPHCKVCWRVSSEVVLTKEEVVPAHFLTDETRGEGALAYVDGEDDND